MARGVRLPRTAGRPPRFLTTGHRRAISLNEAHLEAARRDAGHTLGREAEGILQSLCPSGIAGPSSAKATFRVLADGDAERRRDVRFRGRLPPPRSLTPPRPPLSDQRARVARRCGAAQIVRERSRAKRVARSRWLLLSAIGELVEAVEIYAPEREHVGDDVVTAMDLPSRARVLGVGRWLGPGSGRLVPRPRSLPRLRGRTRNCLRVRRGRRRGGTRPPRRVATLEMRETRSFAVG